MIAFHIYVTGGFQQAVASDAQLAVSKQAVSECIRKVSASTVRHLGHLIDFPRTEISKAAAKEGFLRMKISGVVGCVEGTQICF